MKGHVKLISKPLNECGYLVQMGFILPIGKEMGLARNVRELILAKCNQVSLRQFALS
ncbi:hypothetical protein C7416_101563 [Cupriavidus phytorum]|uniref:Uncharacterized protein n=1 Tax=Cupriavidus phytorum TaxID=3024399 RepID=A0A2W7Q035_9BURK|nr:hypothetical protein C7416_101563 [Cupriavidus alkaliphilus]